MLLLWLCLYENQFCLKIFRSKLIKQVSLAKYEICLIISWYYCIVIHCTYLESLPSKKSLNFSASNVADAMTIFKSLLFFIIFLSNPTHISVYSVLSWASSSIITLYLDNKGSSIISRTNIPSVRNFILVSVSLLQSSNLEQSVKTKHNETLGSLHWTYNRNFHKILL